MKYVLTATVFALSLASVSATAATQQLSNDAVELLNVVSHCPTEFSEISKQGTADAAVRSGTEDVDTYTVGFSAGGFAPTFLRYEVGTLTVTRTFQSSNRPAVPDAPGGVYVYSCKLQYVR